MGGLRDIRGCCGFVGKIERNPVFQSRQAMEYFGRTAPGRVGVGGPL